MSLANDNLLASYGACREASSEAASIKDTPIRKYQFRLCIRLAVPVWWPFRRGSYTDIPSDIRPPRA